MQEDKLGNFENILNNSESKKAQSELSEYLMSKLSNEQTDELNRILSDKNALNNLLSSEKAQSILKKLTGDKNG